MRLPFAPPLAPMLSSAADALPGGEGWQLERAQRDQHYSGAAWLDHDHPLALA